MKYLLLIMLISCGKHSSPPPLDLRDSDGDGMSNYEEVASNPYIAEVTRLEKIQGIMSFSPVGSQEVIQIQLTNSQEDKKRALELLTRNQMLLEDNDYFNEWSRLLTSPVNQMPNIGPTVIVGLNFATPQKSPKSLWFKSGKESKRLADWSKEFKVTLSREELKAILKGKASLYVTNEWMEKSLSNIKEKNYRVFHFDGKEATIYYVSKELTYSEFLSILKIKDPQPIEGKELFFLSGVVKDLQWWSRTLNEDDRLLVKTTSSEVSEAYKEGFQYNKRSVGRVEGNPQGSFILQKHKNALIYLKVRGSSIKRNFAESSFTESYSWGSMRIKCVCTYLQRELTAETTQILSLQQIFAELQIETSEGSLTLSKAIFAKEDSDDQGGYWILGFSVATERFSVRIAPNPHNKILPHGIYASSCRAGPPRRSTKAANISTEAKYEVLVETYVEKL